MMEKKEYVCVNCMSPVDSLYTEYSKDVIRITDCQKCNKVADKYIEYDPVLIFNELFLQYSTAYRHLLLNNKTFNVSFVKVKSIMLVNKALTFIHISVVEFLLK